MASISSSQPLPSGSQHPSGSAPIGPDDYTLMDRIAQGDRAALEGLYQRYSQVVFALAFRILGDRGLAEDLLIDVFFELWRKGERYDATRGAPLTYISTLTRSRAIDRKRGKAARWITAPDGSLENSSTDGQMSGIHGLRGGLAADPAPNPHEASELAEQSDKVRKALAKVPEEHRKTLELSYFEGLSHSEIAEKLQKPLGTVKTHIRMGIIQLRDLLRMNGGSTV